MILWSLGNSCQSNSCRAYRVSPFSRKPSLKASLCLHYHRDYLHPSWIICNASVAACYLMLFCSSQLALHTLLLICSCGTFMVSYRWNRIIWLSLPHSEKSFHLPQHIFAFVALFDLWLPYPVSYHLSWLLLPYLECHRLICLLLSYFGCYCLIMAVMPPSLWSFTDHRILCFLWESVASMPLIGHGIRLSIIAFHAGIWYSHYQSWSLTIVFITDLYMDFVFLFHAHIRKFGNRFILWIYVASSLLMTCSTSLAFFEKELSIYCWDLSILLRWRRTQAIFFVAYWLSSYWFSTCHRPLLLMEDFILIISYVQVHPRHYFLLIVGAFIALVFDFS